MTRDQFEELYRRHGRRLFGLAWQLTGNAADAEDAVQEAFLRALRGLDGYRESGRAGAWIDRILINVLRDRGRRQILFRDRVAPELTHAPRAAGPDPGERADLQQRTQRIHQALARIPRTFREVLVLRHFEERDTTEVAQILGLPSGTVRSRLKRGRDMLIRLCQEDEQ